MYLTLTKKLADLIEFSHNHMCLPIGVKLSEQEKEDLESIALLHTSKQCSGLYNGYYWSIVYL